MCWSKRKEQIFWTNREDRKLKERQKTEEKAENRKAEFLTASAAYQTIF